MQLLPFIIIQNKMETSSFYGKRAGGRCKLPPVESDDSNLSDSGDADSGEEYTPKPGRDHGGNKCVHSYMFILWIVSAIFINEINLSTKTGEETSDEDSEDNDDDATASATSATVFFFTVIFDMLQ